MLPDIANPFFPALVKAVQLRARHHGKTVLLCNTEGVAEAEAEYLEMLASRQIQGIVAMGLAITAEEIRRRVGSGMKIVALDRAAAGGSPASVQADHRAGGWMATDHLLQLGHQAIAHIAGPAGLSVTTERWEGYRDRMREAGIEPGAPAYGDFTESSGHRAAQELIRSGRHFTAIFCANDLMALGAISALRSAGLGVPAQISVVGFDDIELGRYAVPALTTVRQPLAELARVAVDLLVGLLRGEEAPAPGRLAVELVVRESTAAPPRPVAERGTPLGSSGIAPKGGEDVGSREDF
jgi:LacI family transcriptional regulator